MVGEVRIHVCSDRPMSGIHSSMKDAQDDNICAINTIKDIVSKPLENYPTYMVFEDRSGFRIGVKALIKSLERIHKLSCSYYPTLQLELERLGFVKLRVRRDHNRHNLPL